MYFELETEHFSAELLKGIYSIEYNKQIFKVMGYQIENFMLVMHNLYPGVYIKSFVMDDLTFETVKEGVYINNALFIEDELLEEFITLLDMSYNLIKGLVRPAPSEPKVPDLV